MKINLKHFIGHTLYHKEELPFPINAIPDVFTNFRKKVERDSSVRSRFEAPGAMRFPENMDVGELPQLSEFGFADTEFFDDRSVMKFKGGETEALKRLQDYFWNTNSIKTYKQTRNGLVGADYSSKFSA